MGYEVPAGVRVPLIDESAAGPELAEVYGHVKQVMGMDFVPDMFRLLSTRPELLDVLVKGYDGVFNQGVLPRQTKELISAWTSQVLSCTYCVGTHSFFLQVYGGTEELTNAIANATSADDLPVDDRTKVLLNLLTKFTQNAYKIVDADWQRAQDAGWSTDELLEAFFTASLFNAITRMVDGLGLGTTVTASRISQLEVPDESAAPASAGAAED